MKKIKFNKKTKNVLLVILSCVLLFGAIFGIVNMFRQSEEKTKEINPSYSVGSLTNTGAYAESKGSIYTKNAIDCNGLKTNIAFNNTISYKIYFYDFDENFVSATNSLTGNYNTETPFTAKSCRIVITPNEDEEIKWYEVNGYARQLTIKTDKEQYATLDKKIEDSENLCVMVGKGTFNFENNTFNANPTSPFYFASPIDVTEIDTIVCKVATSSLTGKVTFGATEFDKLQINGSRFVGTNLLVVDDYTYVSLDVSSDDTVVIAVDSVSSTILEIYAI